MSPRPDLGTKQRLGYTGSRVDRAAERRGDIVALEQDGHCRFYAIGSETVVLKNAAAGLDPLFTLAETRDFAGVAEKVFLGRVDGAPRFAIALDAAAIVWMLARLRATADPTTELVTIGTAARAGNALLITVVAWLLLSSQGAPPAQASLLVATLTAVAAVGFLDLALRPERARIAYKA